MANTINTAYLVQADTLETESNISIEDASKMADGQRKKLPILPVSSN